MTNNTNKNDILSLFPDNSNNEIDAADMRSYVETIFDDKEVSIVKIDTVVNLASNNSNIYEGSLVTIWNDYNQNRIGLYLSKVNQPTLITDLIQLSSITGEDVDGAINYTYDYIINLDILNIPETYTNIVSITTPNREAGVYEMTMSVIYNFDQNNKKLYMRRKFNGGDWLEFANPAVDTIHNQSKTIMNVIEHAGGTASCEVEMRKEDGSGIFNVARISLSFKRVS